MIKKTQIFQNENSYEIDYHGLKIKCFILDEIRSYANEHYEFQ